MEDVSTSQFICADCPQHHHAGADRVSSFKTTRNIMGNIPSDL